MKKNIEINNCWNVTAIQEAVMDGCGKMMFFQHSDILSGNACRDTFGNAERLDVEAISLDAYFSEGPARVDLVKMDIEGAEYAALQGMVGILKKNPSLRIVVEFWPSGLKNFGVEPRDLVALLLREGFSIWDINEHKKKILPVTADELLRNYTVSRHNWTNLLLKRNGSEE